MYDYEHNKRMELLCYLDMQQYVWILCVLFRNIHYKFSYFTWIKNCKMLLLHVSQGQHDFVIHFFPSFPYILLWHLQITRFEMDILWAFDVVLDVERVLGIIRHGNPSPWRSDLWDYIISRCLENVLRINSRCFNDDRNVMRGFLSFQKWLS